MLVRATEFELSCCAPVSPVRVDELPRDIYEIWLKDGFEVDAELTGESTRDLNWRLLSEMRKAERRTRLRAEWTADGVIERFFDYVPKGKKKVNT
jgi:hypothetical protein